MSAKLVEITLHSLKVFENGETAEKGNNVLTVSLVYPSPGNPSLSTVKTLKLKDMKKEEPPIDFESGINPATEKPFTYLDKILFKEEIYNETMIVIQLTEVQTLSGIEKFFAGLFKGMFKAAWGIYTGGIGNVVLAAAAESVSNLHLNDIDLEKGKKVGIIGKTDLSLKVSDLPDSGDSKVYTRDLSVPGDVKRSYFTKATASSGQKHKTVVILEKGDPNGQISIRVKVLD